MSYVPVHKFRNSKFTHMDYINSSVVTDNHYFHKVNVSKLKREHTYEKTKGVRYSISDLLEKQ